MRLLFPAQRINELADLSVNCLKLIWSRGGQGALHLIGGCLRAREKLPLYVVDPFEIRRIGVYTNGILHSASQGPEPRPSGVAFAHPAQCSLADMIGKPVDVFRRAMPHRSLSGKG